MIKVSVLNAAQAEPVQKPVFRVHLDFTKTVLVKQNVEAVQKERQTSVPNRQHALNVFLEDMLKLKHQWSAKCVLTEGYKRIRVDGIALT